MTRRRGRGLRLGPLLLPLLLCLCACGSAGPPVTVSGDAIPFDNPPHGRVEGATISVLERPELRVVTTADGHFRFDGVPAGSALTLVLEHPDYHLIQTGTHVVPVEGMERLTFQAVSHPVYDLLAAAVNLHPDPTRCQIATTVTRKGKSMYDAGAHGEAGATVSISPALPPEHGPIYFNAMVIPQTNLTETSEDGGVLFVQVPPGDYTLRATKAGVTIRPVRIKCRAGVLVNASPPWGLQVL